MTEPTAVRTDAPLIGLSHVQLLVSDLAASVAWYTLALGLEHYAGSLETGYLALRHRGAEMVVVLTPRPVTGGRDGEGLPSPPAAGAVLDHLAFSVSDAAALRAWADHLSDVGVDHPGVVLENGNPSLQLRDPDGIAIELVTAGRPPG